MAQPLIDYMYVYIWLLCTDASPQTKVSVQSLCYTRVKLWPYVHCPLLNWWFNIKFIFALRNDTSRSIGFYFVAIAVYISHVRSLKYGEEPKLFTKFPFHVVLPNGSIFIMQTLCMQCHLHSLPKLAYISDTLFALSRIWVKSTFFSSLKSIASDFKSY